MCKWQNTRGLLLICSHYRLRLDEYSGKKCNCLHDFNTCLVRDFDQNDFYVSCSLRPTQLDVFGSLWTMDMG